MPPSSNSGLRNGNGDTVIAGSSIRGGYYGGIGGNVTSVHRIMNGGGSYHRGKTDPFSGVQQQHNRPSPDTSYGRTCTAPSEQQESTSSPPVVASSSGEDAAVRSIAQNRYVRAAHNALANENHENHLGIAARPPRVGYGPTARRDVITGSQTSVTSQASATTTTSNNSSQLRPLKPPALSMPSSTTPRTPNQEKNRIALLATSPAPSRSASPVPVTPSPTHNGGSNARSMPETPPQRSASLTSGNSIVYPSSASDGSAVETTSSPSTSSPQSLTPPRSNSTNRIVGNNHSFGKSSADAIEWRKHGKRYRAHLVLEDEQKGGNSFQLINDCSIERYYKVAERVLEQFLSTSIRKNANESELTESYLVGNRLVKFLSIVLPTHYEYFSNNVKLQALRKRSQGQLVELLQYLEEVAVVIDELEYNKYILRDLTPEEEELVQGLTGRPRRTSPPEDSAGSVGPVGTTQQQPPPPPPRKQQQYPLQQTPTMQSVSYQQRGRVGAEDESPQSTATRSHMTDVTTSASVASSSVQTCDSKGGEDGNGGGEQDRLQKRVAHVVRVTEAFSDTYQTQKDEASSSSSQHLKQALMAAAAAAKCQQQHQHAPSAKQRPQLSSSRSPPGATRPPLAPLYVTRSNRSTSPSRNSIASSHHPDPDIASSHHPDPDIVIMDSSFEESTEDGEAPTRARSTNSTLSWDSFSDFDFGNPDDDLSLEDNGADRQQSRMNLLDAATKVEESRRNTHSTTVDTDWVKDKWRSNSSSHNNSGNDSVAKQIPKLKQPPSVPSRAMRVQAAEAISYSRRRRMEDHESEEKKSDSSFPASVSELPWDNPPTLRTKIEERLERASAVQQELVAMEHMNQYSSPHRWRLLSPDRISNNPFDEKEDDDDVKDEEADSPFRTGESRELSNRTLLHHFKGCVKCLLD